MKLFQCQNCGQPLFFENTSCESCKLRLGYLPAQQELTALREQAGSWRTLAEPRGDYRYCANAQHDVCNWLVPMDSGAELCIACHHNRTIPDLSQPQNIVNWRKLEFAKRRLFYTMIKLNLTIATKAESPEGLVFDFLVGQLGRPVMTGHASGVITITLTEADDSEREKQRQNMAESYRTLLGHFRHEIGHYFWDRLIKDTPLLDDFRQAFGDERNDYASALKNYYANGATQVWRDHFVTPYASAHPWEDFAETWAHYFHIVDTLETAGSFGLRIRPRVNLPGGPTTVIDFDPYTATMDHIIDSWIPLTFAVNSINRSMGLSDLYPFVLAPPAIAKLSFIHDLIRATNGQRRPDIRQTPVQSGRPFASVPSGPIASPTYLR
jgi:hypothetical protein